MLPGASTNPEDSPSRTRAFPPWPEYRGNTAVSVSGHGFSRCHTDGDDSAGLQPLRASEGVKKSAEATLAALSERRLGGRQEGRRSLSAEMIEKQRPAVGDRRYSAIFSRVLKQLKPASTVHERLKPCLR